MYHAECPISQVLKCIKILAIFKWPKCIYCRAEGVIIIKIYKVTSNFSNNCSGVKVQYLPLRCSEVEVKVLEIGNTVQIPQHCT